MNEHIEKAKEILKSVEFGENNVCYFCLGYIEHNSNCPLKQALAELSQPACEPPEFTKRARAANSESGTSKSLIRIFLKDACGIIDRQAARIKELETELLKRPDFNKQGHDISDFYNLNKEGDK
jgi:hypothetical protein